MLLELLVASFYFSNWRVKAAVSWCADLRMLLVYWTGFMEADFLIPLFIYLFILQQLIFGFYFLQYFLIFISFFLLSSIKLCQPWNDFCFSPPAEFLRPGSLSCSRTVTLQSCTADRKLNAHSYFSDLSLIKVCRFACATFSACQSFLKRIKNLTAGFPSRINKEHMLTDSSPEDSTSIRASGRSFSVHTV